MQKINNIEFKENNNPVKEFTRKHRLIAVAIVFIAIFILVINVCNIFVNPSKAEVADICEKHLRISRDFSNLSRYENATSEKLENGDTLVTVSQQFYKIVARYDSNMKLISPLEEVYTIPFYPYLLYIISVVCSYLISVIIISALKKKDYFKKLN